MFKDNLRQRKNQLGWTTEELSIRSGVPVGTINKILSGETVSPRYDTILALNRAFEEGEMPEDPSLLREEVAFALASEGADPDSRSSDGCGKDVAGENPHPQPNGERFLTIEDYRKLPEDVRVELIDGRFYYMESPSYKHQHLLSELLFHISFYLKKNHGICEVLPAPMEVQLDEDDYTLMQPDLLIVCDRNKILERTIFGAPDFIAEIMSPASRKKDMRLKLMKYYHAGVREYWIIDPERARVLSYFFEESALIPTLYTFEQEIPVRIYESNLTITLN
jgi:Uma2 family endonuclease